jgi:hypothetical protein
MRSYHHERKTEQWDSPDAGNMLKEETKSHIEFPGLDLP